MAKLTLSEQRSFRLSRATSEHLDATAAASGESRNSLVERLLREALRIEDHPLVRFHTGPAGRREAMIVGTRLRVRDIVATLRQNENDVAQTADYLDVPRSLVSAAVAYYADHSAEVEADLAWAEEGTQAEYERWRRQQAALA